MARRWGFPGLSTAGRSTTTLEAGPEPAPASTVTQPRLPGIGPGRIQPPEAVRAVVERFGYPKLLLGLAILVWGWIFAVHVYYRHFRFGTFDFDLGIYDQLVWLWAHGDDFITVRGLPGFGHHFNPGMLLFVPFYWLGAGPNFLNIAMVAALVLGAVPVFMAAEHHLKSQWLALPVALAFLLHFSNQWFLQETYHPDILAITPMLLAYVYALRERWLPFALWLAFAVSWKEDIALAATMLGVIVAIRGHRRIGLYTAGAALAYFLIATRVVIPAFSPEGAFYENWYGDLGSSPAEIVKTAVVDPSQVVERLDESNAIGYVRDLTTAYAFVPLLAPLGLLVGLPQAMASLLAVQGFAWGTRVHYVAMPLVGLTIAMIEGVALWPARGIRRFLVGLVAAFALATSAVWGISPFSVDYRSGHWPLTENDRQDAMEAAVAAPPSDAAVSATYSLVPHLTHRKSIYTFPNPWRASNWGIRDENAHDPAIIDWLVIDRRTLGQQNAALLVEILASGDWTTVSDRDDILVARRA